MKITVYIKAVIFTVFLSFSTFVNAQNFNDYFIDATLRLDYVFAGNAEKQGIYLDKANKMPGWYGKRKRLSELPVEGNGQIIVRHKNTHEVIYRNSFSTLFQEWLSYDEAITNQRSFENVFLVPMPKDSASITINLFNNRREIISSMTHDIAPSDILIRHIGEKDITPYETIAEAENPDNSINIAFVAEGYTSEELAAFLTDSKEACEAIFSHEPFKSNKHKFNVIAVKSVSKESGTSEPANGIWKNTVLGSHFDTFYSDRYLTTLNLKSLHDVLAGIPYEHIIVLVNTDKYGGGGILNFYNLSMTHHNSFRPVVVHEFGHSFAGLADEYAYETEDLSMYPLDIEPWEQNITTKVSFEDKWKDMIGINGIGLYEGAGYRMKGVYRPAHDCRMRTNDNPEFCDVCKRAITRLINFYTE